MIQSKIEHGCGHITLDRPDKLNALSLKMVQDIQQIIDKWRHDPSVHWVLLTGAGKNFCAGGDVIELYNMAKDAPQRALDFYRQEFDLDLALHRYEKPLVVHYKGISFGGGVGLGCGADIIVADETTRWAMPECRLGIIPDVGVGYFFSGLPRPEALVASLTGAEMAGSDLVRHKLATHYIHAAEWDDILTEWRRLDTEGLSYDAIVHELTAVVARHQAPLQERTAFTQKMAALGDHFNQDHLEDILVSLAAATGEETQAALKNLRNACPWSLGVTFLKYEAGKDWSRADTLAQDLKLLRYAWESGNAQEGSRVTMIDKKSTPQFTPEKVEDLDWALIRAQLS